MRKKLLRRNLVCRTRCRLSLAWPATTSTLSIMLRNPGCRLGSSVAPEICHPCGVISLQQHHHGRGHQKRTSIWIHRARQMRARVL
uniref:Putative secreted protein n=1 Tax=Anopheles darlingi TaxID=43151 RepID=A0A2M4D493_ANODA